MAETGPNSLAVGCRPKNRSNSGSSRRVSTVESHLYQRNSSSATPEMGGNNDIYVCEDGGHTSSTHHHHSTPPESILARLTRQRQERKLQHELMAAEGEARNGSDQEEESAKAMDEDPGGDRESSPRPMSSISGGGGAAARSSATASYDVSSPQHKQHSLRSTSVVSRGGQRDPVFSKLVEKDWRNSLRLQEISSREQTKYKRPASAFRHLDSPTSTDAADGNKLAAGAVSFPSKKHSGRLLCVSTPSSPGREQVAGSYSHLRESQRWYKSRSPKILQRFEVWKDKPTPGPGAYSIPSSFSS